MLMLIRSLRLTFGVRSLLTSVLARRPSIAHDFFLRNPLEEITDSKKDPKFIILCQPGHGGSTEHIPFKTTPKVSVAQPITSKRKFNAYVALTKPNLTILVMLLSVCSYALAPYPATVVQLLCLTAGTSLCSSAANAINMGREPEFDRKMVRTSTRPVVVGLVTPKEAFLFAGVCGTVGAGILYAGVNPLVALLGVLNIVLYLWTYTSLKRRSILNTWIGAIVGAIPPLMGWAAAASNLNDPGAWCLAALLYAWQFPHFNSLSHNIRDQYKRAGYVMTAFENPKLNARVSFRYALLMFPICFGLAYFGIVDKYFMVDSSVINLWLLYLSYKFWRQQNINYKTKATDEGIKLANQHAKKLFWGSVWHLPGILILALLHKKGIWDRWIAWWNGDANRFA